MDIQITAVDFDISQVFILMNYLDIGAVNK